MCRVSWNLGALTSWNPLGLFRPVMGLLYLYLYSMHLRTHKQSLITQAMYYTRNNKEARSCNYCSSGSNKYYSFWRLWIRASWYDYESNQQGATILVNPLNAKLNPICPLIALLGAHHILHVSRIRVNLLFIAGSTCFGRCFRPSSGTLGCIYRFWQYSPKLLPAGVTDELKVRVLHRLREFVSLGVQHAMHMRHVVFVVCQAVPYFAAISHKSYDLLNNVVAHRKPVLIFFTSFI